MKRSGIGVPEVIRGGAICALILLFPFLSRAPAAVAAERPPRDARSLAFRIVPAQEGAFDCGPALVRGLSALLGSRIEGAPIAAPEVPPGRTSLRDLQRMLAARGIASAPFRLDARALEQALDRHGPLVLHYDRPVPHYSLALSRTGSGIVVADPAEGVRRITTEDLRARWSGAVLALAVPADASERLRREAEAAAADLDERAGLLGANRSAASELRAAVTHSKGAPGAQISIGWEPSATTTWTLGARCTEGEETPESWLAAEFGRPLSGSSGYLLGAEVWLPAALRARIRFWMLDDPVAWGFQAAGGISARAAPAVELSGSILYAINARTALSLHLDLDLDPNLDLTLDPDQGVVQASYAGAAEPARLAYRLRLRREEQGFGWWFETGIAVPQGSDTPSGLEIGMELGVALRQKLDST